MIPGVKLIDDILKGLPDNARLRSDIAKLLSEIEQRDVTIAKLQAELQEARAQTDRLKQKKEDMDVDSLKVLHIFFDAGHELSVPLVMQQCGLQMSVVEFHFDELIRRRFIRQSRVGFGNHSGYFELLPEGRKFVMSNHT